MHISLLSDHHIVLVVAVVGVAQLTCGERLALTRAGGPAARQPALREVSGTEELLVEGQEEGQWVGLGASVEGLEVVPEEEAQAWEVPVSELVAQPVHSAAAAAPEKSQ